jgi:hypothetical protein
MTRNDRLRLDFLHIAAPFVGHSGTPASRSACMYLAKPPSYSLNYRNVAVFSLGVAAKRKGASVQVSGRSP